MPTLLLTLLQAAGTAFLSKMLGATLTEKVLSKLTFQLLEWLAAKTDNKLDDGLVEQVKSAYDATP